jgi:preprotein translocase subunit YajC
MKQILTGGVLAAALAVSAGALAQSSMPAPQQTGAEATQSQLPTRTFEGRVKDFTNNTVTLDVAGDNVKVKASKQQTAQLKKGQTVQVQARPSLEASEVEAVQGSFAGDKLIGTVQKVDENRLTVQTSEGATETVKIDEKTAQNLQNGQQVVVQLKEDPRKAKDWQATQIKPM